MKLDDFDYHPLKMSDYDKYVKEYKDYLDKKILIDNGAYQWKFNDDFLEPDKPPEPPKPKPNKKLAGLLKHT